MGQLCLQGVSLAAVRTAARDTPCKQSWPMSGFREIHYEICRGGKKSEILLKFADENKTS